MKGGIIRVADEFMGRFEKALPPEHRVRATRRDIQSQCFDVIIAGPDLPEVKEGMYPPRMTMVMQFRDCEAAGPRGMSLYVYFVLDDEPVPRTRYAEALVGTWRDFDTFNREWNMEWCQ